MLAFQLLLTEQYVPPRLFYLFLKLLDPFRPLLQLLLLGGDACSQFAIFSLLPLHFFLLVFNAGAALLHLELVILIPRFNEDLLLLYLLYEPHVLFLLLFHSLSHMLGEGILLLDTLEDFVKFRLHVKLSLTHTADAAQLHCARLLVRTGKRELLVHAILAALVCTKSANVLLHLFGQWFRAAETVHTLKFLHLTFLGTVLS